MRDERFEMRVPRDLLARLDEWRDGQPVAPTRAAAIRKMIADWLDVHDLHLQKPHANSR